MKSVYLLVDLLSVAFPLAFSRSERFGFGKAWPLAWAAVGLSAVPFIIWDIGFARAGVWDFNPAYVLGPAALGLPMEEWLFFLCIPFACLFIYRQFAGPPGVPVSLPKPGGAFSAAFGALAVGGAALCWFSAPRAYSMAAGAAFAAAAGALAWGRPRFSRPLLVALCVQYAPFLIVNGILTALPVVRYHPEAILGWRIGTIPVEDALYCFAMFALPVALYETFTRARARGKAAASPPAAAEPAPTPAEIRP